MIGASVANYIVGVSCVQSDSEQQLIALRQGFSKHDQANPGWKSIMISDFLIL